jgi:hypothetical protein
VIRELIEEKAPRVLQDLPDAGAGWTAHYAFFARAGFTDAARSLAQARGALLVDLDVLDQDLQAPHI